MPVYDPSNAEVFAYSFKEGLLSRAAHDVKLRVERFSIDIEGNTVRATFDPASLRALHAMKRGTPNPGALSDKDLREIEANVRDHVLHPGRYPEIRYEGAIRRQAVTWTATGELTLHGTTRPLTAVGRVTAGRVVARVKVNQPSFGITPFTALLGALKIKPDVEVELSIPG